MVTVVVGDGGGTYYIPTADMTELRGERWRGNIAQKRVNPDSPNMIEIRAVIPRDVGGFTVREAVFALFVFPAAVSMVWIGLFCLLGFVTYRLAMVVDDYTMTAGQETIHGKEAIARIRS